MDYEMKVESEKINIKLPIKNTGKYRWKERDSIDEYGKVFSTAEKAYSDKSYLEWQIGYDVEVSKTIQKKDKKGNIIEPKKSTSLNQESFIGGKKQNRKKYPYELSEILYLMRLIKMINDSDIEKLIKGVNASNEFFEVKYAIAKNKEGTEDFGGVRFKKQHVKLPTFIYGKEDGKPYVEISIQKQQNASGVQPMLYVCIPIKNFKDGTNYIGQKSGTLDNLGVFVIDEKNKDFVLKLFKIFSLCSENHKKDILEILKIIKKKIKDDESKEKTSEKKDS